MTVDTLTTTTTWNEECHPAWEVSGPLGRVTYRSLGNHLYLEPAHAPSDSAVAALADEALHLAITGTDTQMYALLTGHYNTFPPAPAGVPTTTAGWRELRGDDLVDAMRAAKWHARPDDTIGGWTVMPHNAPPSTGTPAVGCFLAPALAQHIADLHNAGLPTALEDAK